MHLFHSPIPLTYSTHLFHSHIQLTYSAHLFNSPIPLTYLTHLFHSHIQLTYLTHLFSSLIQCTFSTYTSVFLLFSGYAQLPLERNQSFASVIFQVNNLEEIPPSFPPQKNIRYKTVLFN